MIKKLSSFFLCVALACYSSAKSLPFNNCSDTDPVGPVRINNIDWSRDHEFYVLDMSAYTSVPLYTTDLDVSASVLGIKLPGYSLELCNSSSASICAEESFRVGLHVNHSVLDSYISSHLPIEVDLTVRGKTSHGTVSTCVSTEVVPTSGFSTSCPYLRDHHYNNLFSWWRTQHSDLIHVDSDVDNLLHRFAIFKDHTDFILEHNGNTQHTYRVGHNQFSHLENQEYIDQMGLRNHYPSRKNDYAAQLSDSAIPDAVDWRNHGAVTPVKNQGQCGSCWSFSTTGALEGAYAIKHGNLVSFSEQELVSCDTTDNGCNGGLMDNAFNWIRLHQGLCSESSYPYVSGDTTSTDALKCMKTCDVVEGSQVKDVVDVPQDEDSFARALSNQPVSIAIEADKLGFQLYHSGIYSGNCGTNLDHGVLAVGYGDGYWLVKNSWGESWGDSGYIKIARGNGKQGGECGILLSASYPLL